MNAEWRSHNNCDSVRRPRCASEFPGTSRGPLTSQRPVCTGAQDLWTPNGTKASIGKLRARRGAAFTLPLDPAFEGRILARGGLIRAKEGMGGRILLSPKDFLRWVFRLPMPATDTQNPTPQPRDQYTPGSWKCHPVAQRSTQGNFGRFFCVRSLTMRFFLLAHLLVGSAAAFRPHVPMTTQTTITPFHGAPVGARERPQQVSRPGSSKNLVMMPIGVPKVCVLWLLRHF